MNDRPTAGELIEAVRLFLEKELLPGLSDARLRFQTLVAANVLAVAGRELTAEEATLREEWQALAGLLDERKEMPVSVTELRRGVWEMNERLCGQIRTGQFDGAQAPLWALFRRQVTAKLLVANPRYLQQEEKKAASAPHSKTPR